MDVEEILKVRNDLNIKVANLKEEQKSLFSDIKVEKSNKKSQSQSQTDKLKKEIADLDSVKAVKLKENKVIMDGQVKLNERTEEMKKELVDTKKKVKRITPILAEKEQDEQIWLHRILELKTAYNKAVKKLDGIKVEIGKSNKELKGVNKTVEEKKAEVDTLEKVKFVISELKEILEQMYDEMKDVYARAGNDFPYAGTFNEYIASRIDKKLWDLKLK